MAFAKFMAGPVGRSVRIVAGLALIALGLFSIGGTGGIILALVGVLPIVAGAANVCMIAPVIGAPFSGAKALRS